MQKNSLVGSLVASCVIDAAGTFVGGVGVASSAVVVASRDYRITLSDGTAQVAGGGRMLALASMKYDPAAPPAGGRQVVVTIEDGAIPTVWRVQCFDLAGAAANTTGQICIKFERVEP